MGNSKNNLSEVPPVSHFQFLNEQMEQIVYFFYPKKL